MGLFCSNIHLRTTDRAAVDAALDGHPASVVLDAEGGWVSVYVEGLIEQADGPERIAASLSTQLATAAISFSIHDSDIAQYWLHDCGRLIDSYNSWPGYFEGAAPQAIGGNLDELSRFCATGYGVRDLRRILSADVVFADDVVDRLAEMLGIKRGRATADYRDVAVSGAEDPLGAALASASSQIQSKPLAEYPHSAVDLVQAAADGDVAGIERLATVNQSVDTPAPGPIPGAAGVDVNALTAEMTPLAATIMHDQRAAMEALLDLGADPNMLHAQHGSAIHVAAGMGRAELLEVLLNRGGDPSGHPKQQQTPLEALATGRTVLEALTQAQELMDSLGLDATALFDKPGLAPPPAETWDDCEDLLRSRGAES